MFQLTEKVEYVSKILNMAKQLGVANAVTTNESFDGKNIEVNGRHNLFMGNCGYLGLATDERFMEAAKLGIDRFGTFFSSSRAFAGLHLNEQLEELWEVVFERPTLVSPSTTMGHFSVLPVLIGENDLIVMDKQTHISVYTAAMVCKGQGTVITGIPHNRMDYLEAKILDAKGKYDKIWFLADGVYSMFGDLCDAHALYQLMDKYENLYAYVDDSHGMSWAGKNGQGKFLEHAGYYHDKLFMAMSTNKAAAAGGGVLVFPNERLKNAVKNTGATLVYSGPQSPASLMAGIEIAKFQTTQEFKGLQENLQERINFFAERAQELNVPVIHDNRTPIFFVGAGKVETGMHILIELQNEGIFADGAGYPSVPKNNSGIRFTITNYLSYDDLEGCLQSVSKVLRKLEQQNKFNVSKIQEDFEPLVRYMKAANKVKK